MSNSDRSEDLPYLAQEIFASFSTKNKLSSPGFSINKYIRGLVMKRIAIAGLILVSACAGGSYSTTSSSDGFEPNICAKIPVGIEAYQYMDPSVKGQKISCADVERCAALYGGTPPNVPCE